MRLLSWAWITVFLFMVNLLTANGNDTSSRFVRIGADGTDKIHGMILMGSSQKVLIGEYTRELFFKKKDGSTLKLASKGLSDAFVAILDVEGNCQWASSVGGKKEDRALAICEGEDGFFYMAGSFSGELEMLTKDKIAKFNSTTESSFFLSKWNLEGSLQWAIPLAGQLLVKDGDQSSEATLSLAVNSTGQSYVSTWFRGVAQMDMTDSASVLNSGERVRSYVASYDRDGQYRWAKIIDDLDETYADRILALAIQKDGNCAFVGNSRSVKTIDGKVMVPNRIHLVGLLDVDGEIRWLHRIVGELMPSAKNNQFQSGGRFSGVVADGSGGLIAIGVSSGRVHLDPRKRKRSGLMKSGRSPQGVVAHYDKKGKLKLAFKLAKGAPCVGHRISRDKKGQLLVSGFGGTMSRAPSLFVALHGKSGRLKWHRRLFNQNPMMPRATALITGKKGEIFISGYFGVSLEFEKTKELLKCSGESDGFLLRLNKKGK